MSRRALRYEQKGLRRTLDIRNPRLRRKYLLPVGKLLLAGIRVDDKLLLPRRVSGAVPELCATAKYRSAVVDEQ